MDIAFDVETYEKKGSAYYPVLDGTGKHFLIGSITNDKGKSKVFYDRKDMWNYILEQGRKARRNGHTIYAYAHNIKYDFFNIFQMDKNLVIISEFPFIATYYVKVKKEIKEEKWKKYRAYLDMSKKRYSYQIRDGVVYIDLKEEAVRFIDSLSIFRMSLKRVGEMIGIEKLELPKKLKKEEIQELLPYVIRDTEILIKGIKMLKEKLKEDGIKIKRVVTMNQIAISYLIKMMMELETPIFDGKKGKLIQGKARRKVRKAYRGGRDEAWKLGITKGASSIDCNSLYPYSASIMRFPDLNTEVFWNKPDKKDWAKLLGKTGVCRAMMHNKGCEIGLLPVRLPHISYYPRGGKYMIGTWTNGEIIKALKEGYEIINIQFIITYGEIDNPFRSIMPKLYELRGNESIGGFNKEFYKSIMNGGIGKFAQVRIGQEIVFDSIEKAEEYKRNNYRCLGGIRDDSRIMKFKKDIKEFKYKPYYCPLIPALVTAQARMYMYDIYKKIETEKLVHTSTDNCVFKGKIKDLKEIEIDEKKFGAFKIQFENKEFECWGRKLKRTDEEIKISGASKNDLRVFNKETGEIKFVKMQGLGKENTGEFVEQTRNLKERMEEYIKQEEELGEILIYIDESILVDVDGTRGDGKNKDDIMFFRNDIDEVNRKVFKPFGKELNRKFKEISSTNAGLSHHLKGGKLVIG